MNETREKDPQAEASGAQLWRLNTLGLLGEALQAQVVRLGLDPEVHDGTDLILTWGVASEVLAPHKSEDGTWSHLW